MSDVSLPLCIRLSLAGALIGGVFLAACAKPPKPPEPVAPMALSDLGINATESRPFIQTNKEAAFFYGEAAGPQTTGYQGLNIRGFLFLDDWQWTAQGTALGSDHFTGATIYPDHAERRYAGGLSERITLIDNTDALLVEPQGSGPLRLQPLFNDGRSDTYYDIRTSGSALLLARKNHLTRSSTNDYPIWLAIKAAGADVTVSPQILIAGGLKPSMFSPGALDLPSATPVVFAFADTPEDALALADRVLTDRDALEAARAQRMQQLLNDSHIVTEDARFNAAFAWTRLSMDALVMNQRGKGVFAGLPWFNNYWGRDTFISLPGAFLVTGRFEEARDILTSFSQFQNAQSTDPAYGRVPNFVSLDNVTYNTADATPWFVIQAAAYADHSGDTAFLQELWPVVERAADGALRSLDGEYFLKHGDQETWMDASAGPGREWSPRGNRAVEIQGLWYQQLLATARIADAVGYADKAGTYRAMARTLATAFMERYYDANAGLLVDHLNADGSPDHQLRPNQFLALRAFDLDPGTKRDITRKAAAALVYPYGVASLEQNDDNFHPWHEAPQYYVKDAAYHNGTVWGWLSGPVVSLLAEQGAAEKAYEQIQNLNHLCLERGTVGVLPELLDALPRPGKTEPNLSGAVFQAWSHAEYLRNVYQDFAGVTYVAADHVRLQPRLPQSWGRTQVRFRLGAGAVVATLQRQDPKLDVWLRGEGTLPGSARVSVAAAGVVKDVAVKEGVSVHVVLSADRVEVNEQSRKPDDTYVEPDTSYWSDFAWQQPRLRDNLPALQGGGYPLLDLATIKQTSSTANTVLSVTDPAGDDRGATGTYVYPTGSQFQPGILDGTGLEIREDSGAYYFNLRFKALVQPGWNPQYGFQLTMAALLFDTGVSGQLTVGRNAQYTLPSGQSYQYVIYVGGGLLVEDATGKTLAEYRPQPADVANPLGSADTATVSFRMPKTILPSLPQGTRVTVLVGSQDDHGGGGLGDFRNVGTDAGDWVGGGKTDPAGPNVYDVMSGTIYTGP